MKLEKIIAKCWNAQDYANYDLEKLKDYMYIVKGKSKFFSGWGRAEGVNAYDLVLCKDAVQAAKIIQGLRKDNTIYINRYRIDYFKAIDNKNVYTFRVADECTAWL